jgi:hypothetical protein
MGHLKKHWDPALQDEAIEDVQQIVSLRSGSSLYHMSKLITRFYIQFYRYYVKIFGENEQGAAPTKLRRQGSGVTSKVTRLLRELSDDDTDEESQEARTVSSSSAPTESQVWLKDFNYYVNTFDQLAENQTMVQWWGVRFDDHPFLFMILTQLYFVSSLIRLDMDLYGLQLLATI